MGKIGKKPTIDTFLAWAYEAIQMHMPWHKDSWEDYEFRDGIHWTQEDANKLIDKGINPLTINRIFPVLNLIYGNYIRNQKDIVAKGRTKHDNELAQVASEGIQLVIDQNGGTSIQREAFHHSIITGFGCVYTGFNSDPRKENISLRHIPWYAIFWDPYADPWFNINNCRYVFTAEWKDVENLKMFFPDEAKDIDEVCREIADGPAAESYLPGGDIDDVGMLVENYKKLLSAGDWVNTERKRVRPIEMWYTTVEPVWFGLMPDGRALELDKYPINEQYQIVQAAREVVKAHIKKMHVATFLGRLLLQDVPSPFPHSEYPHTSFVGYLDRFNFPYGIPRQIKEQNMEVNKRRSMALALMNSRRVTTEEGAAEDLNAVHREANRLDGFIMMKKGKMDRVHIQELSELAAPQIDMMRQSEQEIQEIVGANDEALGYDTPPQSGVALEKKRQFSATVTLSLMENAFRSQKLLGEKILSLIQNTWTEEKVLRVIDRLSGVEKFIEINKRIQTEVGTIEIKNDITQARFDLVVTTKEISDTMRDKNLDLLFSAINKAPPEAVAPLLNVAFEISDIPEKERILDKIRIATGMPEEEAELTADQRRQKLQEAKLQQEAEQQKLAAADDMKREIERRKDEATIEKLKAEGEAKLLEAQANQRKVEQEGFYKSQELVSKLFGGNNDTTTGS